MTRPTWRLLRTPPAAGAWNMAVDEAILHAVSAGTVLPTLRLFAWQTPCLSLGCFQPLADINPRACTERGIDVVRRPTGGSAILHDNELTYCIAGLETNACLQGDILASYHSIASVLLRALTDLGVPAELAPQTPAASGPGRPAPCFVRPAGHEILVGGRKLVGSAQMRRAGAILQHGAIPLDGDLGAIAVLLDKADGERADWAQRLRSGAVTVREAAGRTIAFDEMAAAIAAAMATVWQVDLREGELTPDEQRRAAALERDKYRSEAWTAGPPAR